MPRIPHKGNVAMMDEAIEVVRGSGNVFRDFGHPDADREQLRAILAAKIIGVLDDRGLSVRDARALTGTSAADFSRIRRANLGRFTIDRLTGDRGSRERVPASSKRSGSRTRASVSAAGAVAGERVRAALLLGGLGGISRSE
jgi:predicted XRE-type DNA-binding protein